MRSASWGESVGAACVVEKDVMAKTSHDRSCEVRSILKLGGYVGVAVITLKRSADAGYLHMILERPNSAIYIDRLQ